MSLKELGGAFDMANVKEAALREEKLESMGVSWSDGSWSDAALDNPSSKGMINSAKVLSRLAGEDNA